MLKLNFHENIDDKLLKFAVIVSKYNGKWILCKHKERNTYELPAGHREKDESIEDTAKRELFEETGAIEFSLKEISAFSVTDNTKETYGMLYYAIIKKIGRLPNFEIEKVGLFSEIPGNLTYPFIQPILIKKAEELYKE